jgi:hypothetical protein
MVENIKFPVFLASKDCGAMQKYATAQELYRALERIDVENHEYEAWDSERFRVEMFLRNEKDWLGLKQTARQNAEFKDALVRYARTLGVLVDPASLTADKPIELYEMVDKAVTARVREMPWYRRFLRRF